MSRHLFYPLVCALFLAAPALKAEEKKHHCTSHHWEMPQYRAETDLQTKGLLASLSLMGGMSLYRNGAARRKR
ncbi:MAG: hypothetical protein IT210_15790 [Armatimonadetes bacterium]|nr:hypothetical protein [Armatimonadota bacterium]